MAVRGGPRYRSGRVTTQGRYADLPYFGKPALHRPSRLWLRAHTHPSHDASNVPGIVETSMMHALELQFQMSHCSVKSAFRLHTCPDAHS